MLPSSVVTGFRRGVACNVSKTKNRIAPRNVVLTQNAKSRQRPLGGLKPALRPPSGINTGVAKRKLFPSPRLRGKVPEGRKGGMKSPSGVDTEFAKIFRQVFVLYQILTRRNSGSKA